MLSLQELWWTAVFWLAPLQVCNQGFTGAEGKRLVSKTNPVFSLWAPPCIFIVHLVLSSIVKLLLWREALTPLWGPSSLIWLWLLNDTVLQGYLQGCIQHWEQMQRCIWCQCQYLQQHWPRWMPYMQSWPILMLAFFHLTNLFLLPHICFSWFIFVLMLILNTFVQSFSAWPGNVLNILWIRMASSRYGSRCYPCDQGTHGYAPIFYPILLCSSGLPQSHVVCKLSWFQL